MRTMRVLITVRQDPPVVEGTPRSFVSLYGSLMARCTSPENGSADSRLHGPDEGHGHDLLEARVGRRDTQVVVR